MLNLDTHGGMSFQNVSPTILVLFLMLWHIDWTKCNLEVVSDFKNITGTTIVGKTRNLSNLLTHCHQPP